MREILIKNKKYIIELKEGNIEGRNGKIYLPEIRKTVYEILDNKMLHIASFPKNMSDSQIIEWIKKYVEINSKIEKVKDKLFKNYGK